MLDYVELLKLAGRFFFYIFKQFWLERFCHANFNSLPASASCNVGVRVSLLWKEWLFVKYCVVSWKSTMYFILSVWSCEKLWIQFDSKWSNCSNWKILGFQTRQEPRPKKSVAPRNGLSDARQKAIPVTSHDVNLLKFQGPARLQSRRWTSMDSGDDFDFVA